MNIPQSGIFDRPYGTELDALADILRTVRVDGSVFCRAELGAPWAIRTRGADEAIFHAIVRGAGEVEVGGTRQAFSAGDLLVLPHGQAHTLRDAAGAGPGTWIAELPALPGPGGLPCVRHGGSGAPTSILCGTFRFGEEARELLLPHLPPLLHARSTDAAGWLDATLRMLAEEVTSGRPGGEWVVARLADVLFVQALRGWIAEAPGVGWLGALGDPQLARVLALIHGDPARAWTAELLARRVGLSRTVLFERFSRAVGEPPAAYIERWRMSVARTALRRPDRGMAEIAASVGYASEAAFSRAFKRHVGSPPSEWRRSLSRPGIGI